MKLNNIVNQALAATKMNATPAKAPMKQAPMLSHDAFQKQFSAVSDNLLLSAAKMQED